MAPMDDGRVELQRDIGKIWGALERQNGDVRELKTALIGLDGSNGLRGEFREFAEDMEHRMTKQDEVLERQDESLAELKAWRQETTKALSDYLANGRKQTCHGIEALELYREEVEAEEKARAVQWDQRETELRKSRNAMWGAVIVAFISAAATSIPKILELLLGARGQ